MPFSLAAFGRTGLVVAALLAWPTLAKAAGLTGDTVTCSSASAFVCSASTATVGPTIEFRLKDGTDIFTENFHAAGLIITFNFTGAVPSIDITNTDQTEQFIGVTFVSSDIAAIGASNFTLTPTGGLEFTASGITATRGDQVKLDLTTAPEPGSLSLLGTGMLAVGGLVRRRFPAPRS